MFVPGTSLILIYTFFFQLIKPRSDLIAITSGIKFLFFAKVAHDIHGWRAGKLQTCFSKDTGCRNQSTLTMTCECLACFAHT